MTAGQTPRSSGEEPWSIRHKCWLCQIADSKWIYSSQDCPKSRRSTTASGVTGLFHYTTLPTPFGLGWHAKDRARSYLRWALCACVAKGTVGHSPTSQHRSWRPQRCSLSSLSLNITHLPSSATQHARHQLRSRCTHCAFHLCGLHLRPGLVIAMIARGKERVCRGQARPWSPRTLEHDSEKPHITPENVLPDFLA